MYIDNAYALLSDRLISLCVRLLQRYDPAINIHSDEELELNNVKARATLSIVSSMHGPIENLLMFVYLQDKYSPQASMEAPLWEGLVCNDTRSGGPLEDKDKKEKCVKKQKIGVSSVAYYTRTIFPAS